MNINDESSIQNNDIKTQFKRRNTLFILIGTLIFLISIIASFILGLNSAYGFNSLSGISSITSDTSVYRKFVFVKNVLDKAYDGEIDNEILIDSAIRGMVNSLGDPYTSYMDKEEFAEFNSRSKGNYVGVGIQIGIKDGKIVIVSVFDKSPAFEAGIKVGDFIVSVSGEEVGEDINRAITLIKGESLTNVSMTIERDGEILDFDVQRKSIDILPVEYKEVSEDVGYIKINSFDEKSASYTREALENLDVKGIILDLRGNPGGLLNECVDIASEFLSEDLVIVSTIDKYGTNEVIKAKKGIAEDLEIVVLGDSSSASASEVLIGALIDHKRATFVGTTTFGKGLVQRVFEIGDGSGVKVTISKYYTPNGEYINGTGIKPDVEVKRSENTLDNSEDPQYSKALEIINGKVSK